MDVPSVVATGRNPIVPVVVMDTSAEQIDLASEVDARVDKLDALFTVTN